MYLKSRDRVLNLSVPQIMGILNITPDSFSDGGKYLDLAVAIDHAAVMVNSGATIIDIGGESTRPGAKMISAEEEAERVIPTVIALTQRFDVFISIDTSKMLVIKESIAAGIHLINDVRSLREPDTLKVVAASQLPVIIMHMKGNPETMQRSPYYEDIISEVKEYFSNQIERYEEAGIMKDRILLDPGFGFGKTLCHNYQLLSQLYKFHCFGLPILVGMSRKSMIGQLLNLPPEKRITGSVACAVIAALQGANIIRVHDVIPTIEAMRVVQSTLSLRKNYFQ